VLLMCQMFFEPEPSSAAGGLDPALPSEASGRSTS
jgi:hypothetical protein